ncbi:MAG: hypothetical protein ACI9NC_001005, partial [Verrucomicrobiales bacterium]
RKNGKRSTQEGAEPEESLGLLHDLVTNLTSMQWIQVPTVATLGRTEEARTWRIE